MATILYLARLGDELGVGQETLANPPSQLSQLKQQLANRGEKWQQLLTDNSIQVAINQTLADDGSTITDNDEIAFFPPVTGG